MDFNAFLLQWLYNGKKQENRMKKDLRPALRALASDCL